MFLEIKKNKKKSHIFITKQIHININNNLFNDTKKN